MSSRASLLGLSALFSFSLWSVHGRAQSDDPSPSKDSVGLSDDKDADDSDNAATTKKPTEGKKGEAHESFVAPKPVVAEEPPPVGPIERLPPTAYPEWQIRGIRGGSLWQSNNMHGMPWPYYPKTGIGVSGYAWIDTGYETIQRGNHSEPNYNYLVSQGRALLRFTPTYSSGSWYAQTQAELVANKDQSVAQPNVVDVDDLWIRAGQWKQWDVQLGRFEAFEVYHFGMGMDLNTLERQGAADTVHSAPDVFELGGNSNIVYRQSGITNLALHAYPGDFVRLELLSQFGFDTASGIDTLGIRPAIVLDFGWLKLKTAGDLRKQFPAANTSKESRSVWGNVTSAQIVLDPYVEFGANVAYGRVQHYSPTNSTDPNAARGDFDTAGSVRDLDVGGFANVRVVKDLLIGGGANENQETDQQAGTFTHLQAFGAIQYLVLDQLYIKVVGAYAKAHLAPGGVAAWDNTMKSVRLRLLYPF